MGHHNLRFDGDPHSLDGVWSPPTSRAKYNVTLTVNYIDGSLT
jgi:hypothetical protein